MADTTLDRLLRVALLRAELYSRALASATLLPAGQPLRATITTLQTQATAQAERVRGLGSTIDTPAAASYDFAGNAGLGGGPFANALVTQAEFLKLAQLIEDLMVRAALTVSLTAALDDDQHLIATRLQGAAARGAAALRRIRGAAALNPKPWITGTAAGTGFTSARPAGSAQSQVSTAAIVYGVATLVPSASTAEDNLEQGMLLLPAANANTEAFDEPIPVSSIDMFLSQFSR